MYESIIGHPEAPVGSPVPVLQVSFAFRIGTSLRYNINRTDSFTINSTICQTFRFKITVSKYIHNPIANDIQSNCNNDRRSDAFVFHQVSVCMRVL